MYLETMPRKTTYSFVSDGLLVINRSENDFDNIMISVITEDMTEPLRTGAPLLETGDLLLSYLDPDKKAYMQRYLRRVDLDTGLRTSGSRVTGQGSSFPDQRPKTKD